MSRPWLSRSKGMRTLCDKLVAFRNLSTQVPQERAQLGKTTMDKMIACR